MVCRVGEAVFSCPVLVLAAVGGPGFRFPPEVIVLAVCWYLVWVAVLDAGDVDGGLGVAGQHVGAGGRGDPHQQIDLPVAPQLVGEVGGELGLADSTEPGQDLAHDHGAGGGGEFGVGGAFLPAVDQVGYHSDTVRPLNRGPTVDRNGGVENARRAVGGVDADGGGVGVGSGSG